MQLFSESAHNPETNQRPRPPSINQNEYGTNSLNFSVNSILPITDSRAIQMHSVNPPKLQSEKMQSFLNEAVNRHSFSESIYSEPYSNNSRYDMPVHRIELRQQQQQHRDGISDFIHQNNGSGPHYQSSLEISGNRNVMSNNNQSQFVQLSSDQRDEVAASVSMISNSSYDTSSLRSKVRNEFFESNNLNSNKSNVVQNKNVDDIIITAKTNGKKNDPKIEFMMESLPVPIIVLPTNKHDQKQEQQQSNLLLEKNDQNQYKFPNSGDNNTHIQEEETKGCENNTVVMRRQKLSTNIVDRPVRRVSYLRATANDTSVQEVNSAESSILNKKSAGTVEDDVRPFIEFLKR